MTLAYAHETAFPHSHPHDTSSAMTDLLLTSLWFGALAVAVYFGSRWLRTSSKPRDEN